VGYKLHTQNGEAMNLHVCSNRPEWLGHASSLFIIMEDTEHDNRAGHILRIMAKESYCDDIDNPYSRAVAEILNHVGYFYAHLPKKEAFQKTVEDLEMDYWQFDDQYLIQAAVDNYDEFFNSFES
jgi:hypothetical protein